MTPELAITAPPLPVIALLSVNSVFLAEREVLLNRAPPSFRATWPAKTMGSLPDGSTLISLAQMAPPPSSGPVPSALLPASKAPPVTIAVPAAQMAPPDSDAVFPAKLPPATVRSDAAKTAPPWAALLVLKTNLSVSVAVPPT